MHNTLYFKHLVKQNHLLIHAALRVLIKINTEKVFALALESNFMAAIFVVPRLSTDLLTDVNRCADVRQPMYRRM